MNRRSFLKWSFASDDKPAPAPISPETLLLTTPSAGYPRDYIRHMPVLVHDVRAWLVRDDTGFYAVDAICPHLGGIVRFVDKALLCPCHASVYAPDGTVTSGPAQHSLRYLRVDMDERGKLMIQRDRTVSPDDRFIA